MAAVAAANSAAAAAAPRKPASCVCTVPTPCAPPTRARGPPPRPGGRIVGGAPLDISAVPWQVAVELTDGLLCGGSIISSTWVLTTAHYFALDGFDVRFLSVRAGTSTRESGGTVYGVTEAIIHKSFSWVNGDYDIAVIAINGSYTLGPNIQAIALADTDLAAGTFVNITGWGYTDIIGPTSEKLLAVSTVIIEQSACNATWGDITDNMFCTRYEGEGPCTGDGGGAVVKDKVQYGVFSRTLCAVNQIPEVHTSVAALRSWISEATGV
ncbi:trypsin delta-like [Schistocerca nitens]|uniref:trypsin delta-like n=1 Tax=Schistocerca nitens TaxID=7011 RepID=UPI002117B1FF|nr:trypsin delta-like [Schistocerca nitens]